MVAVPKILSQKRITPEEYFELDAASQERLEYVDGQIVGMAGTSLEHNEIAINICLEIKTQFRGRPCKVYMQSVRVRVSDDMYRYPDVVALCGDVQTADTRPKTLLNPAAIFEVLSPSTQDKDRGEKFDEYAEIATLSDYVLVAQNAMRVRHYRRLHEDRWEIDTYTQPEDILMLESLQVVLKLSEIYSEIAFGDSLPTADVK